MKTKARRRRAAEVLKQNVDIPTFARLAARYGNPLEGGPPSGEWKPWDIDHSLYAFDSDDPRWYRTPSMNEMHAHIPTGAWPAIGDPHGVTGEREVASA